MSARRKARRVARPASNACATLVYERAGSLGGASGSARTVPPSWSANLIPAELAKMPGRTLVTTTASAFWSGVIASAAAKMENAITRPAA
jgi:hypothetical protein